MPRRRSTRAHRSFSCWTRRRARTTSSARVLPLLAHERRVVAMDMLGFGMSPPVPAPQTIERVALGAFALLDALGVARAAVLGHHTGAAVALEMAAREPER